MLCQRRRRRTSDETTLCVSSLLGSNVPQRRLFWYTTIGESIELLMSFLKGKERKSSDCYQVIDSKQTHTGVQCTVLSLRKTNLYILFEHHCHSDGCQQTIIFKSEYFSTNCLKWQ